MIKDLLRPWRSVRMWNTLGFLSLNVLSWIGFALVISFLATSIGLFITYPIATIFIFATFYIATALSYVERSRIAALLGTKIDVPMTPKLTGGWFSRTRQIGTSKVRWKYVGYTLLSPIIGTFTMALTVCLWSASLLLIALPTFAAALPGGSAEFGLFNVGQDLSIGGFIIGVVLLAIAVPWATLGCGKLHVEFARLMLGPSKDVELEQQVSTLKQSRTAAATTAETERARIERDLHDGAQQRLVALAMDLGRAEAQFDNDPEAARKLLASARTEAAAALTELRDLVRGMHPAILSDRGLDAALSAVVARSPIPVELDVKIAERPQAHIESAAYFVVMEGLMNVIKHAQATSVHIDIERVGDRLAISIADNGVGGADPTKGTGLKGLYERAIALGGWMQILSPVGGPTSLIVELPCAS